MTQRSLLRLTGDDRHHFVQNLVTNDVSPGHGLTWAALLTPQGKYLADFFLLDRGEETLLDVAAPLAGDLMKRLTMYKLRAKVGLEETSLTVARGTDAAPDGALADPRHPALGWRLYGASGEDGTDWDALRVAHVIPETGVELIPNESYPLEVGFERLHGVDFRKGCYVGQEVTARMKHKTELKKGLVQVQVEGSAPIGTEITIEGRAAGTLYTKSGGKALAYLRFDRATAPMQAGAATVIWDGKKP